jgi:hypothetical protein
VAESGAEKAVLAILRLAQRLSKTRAWEAREAIIQAQGWAVLSNPLLWAAAAGNHSHPILEWLARVLGDVPVVLPALRESELTGVDAVFEAWQSLRAGLRACGVT